jgi:restriction system protein
VFIKPGGMSGNIPSYDIKRSVLEFTLPEIEIVQPKIILALGSNTIKSLQYASINAVELPHPAARGMNLEAMEKVCEVAWLINNGLDRNKPVKLS